jgi:Rieske Fe-S protein
MKTSRRDFTKRALYGMLAFLGLGFVASGIRLFVPFGVREKELAFFPLISEDELPRSGVKKTELLFSVSGKQRKTRVFIVSSAAGLVVLSATCSHLGCLVNYQKEKQEFVCPCHGGRYDMSGKNIAGPPPMPLTQFPIKVLDGTIHVGIKV